MLVFKRYATVCLILLSFQPDAPQPLVVAANRDEFYARPALGAHYWSDDSNIFAGRDLTAGGTWLGTTRTGRFAALTNFSAGDPVRDYPASRGALVADFLGSDRNATDYACDLDGERYAGFNLLLFDGSTLCYTNNKGFDNEVLAPGHYGLSNAELRAAWPKALDGATALGSLLENQHDPEHAQRHTPDLPSLLAILGDSTPPADQRLPQRQHLQDTPIETQRALAARFIAGTDYGTRAMTVLRFGPRHTDVYEQQIGPEGKRGEAVFARVPRAPHP